MPDETVRQIELRQLETLRKQAATYGLAVPAHISGEIERLEGKYQRRRRSDPKNSELDYAFLMDTVSDTLKRFNVIEEHWKQDAIERPRRQRHLDIWLTVITVMLVLLCAVVWFKL